VIKKFLLLSLGPVLIYSLYYFEYRGLILFYPSIISGIIGTIFFLSSLIFKPCVVVRIAQAQEGKAISENGLYYCNNLNKCWVFILYFNSAISFFLAWYGLMDAWAAFNGFISYLMIFSFVAIEYKYRIKYKMAHP
jgi:uncharacterized membrane protein